MSVESIQLEASSSNDVSSQMPLSDDFFDHYHTRNTYTQLEVVDHLLDQPDPYKNGIVIPEIDRFVATQLCINDTQNIYNLTLDDQPIMTGFMSSSGNVFSFDNIRSNRVYRVVPMLYENMSNNMSRPCVTLTGLRLYVGKSGIIPQNLSIDCSGYVINPSGNYIPERITAVIYPFGTYPLSLSGYTKSVRIISKLSTGYLVNKINFKLFFNENKIFFADSPELVRKLLVRDELMSPKQLSESINFSRLPRSYIVIPDVPTRDRKTTNESHHDVRVIQTRYVTYNRETNARIDN